MKIETARKNAMEIHRRLSRVGGLIGTPNTGREAVQIKRVWVFGSTVKGKLNPNDLDVLVEASAVGRKYSAMENQVGRCKRSFNESGGWVIAKCPIEECFKWLRHGMKRVSLHWTAIDTVQPDVKVMLYPRNDFANYQYQPTEV